MLPEESGEFLCPVTGRKWETRPEWVVSGPRSTFRFYVLDRAIVMCRTFGSTGRDEVEWYCEAVRRILEEFHVPGRPMVMMEDYSQLHETDSGGRHAYTAFHMGHQHVWKGLLFFGMNPFLKLLLRLSKRMLPVRIPVDAYGGYAQALGQAFQLLGWDIEPVSAPVPSDVSRWSTPRIAVVFRPMDARRVLRVEVKGTLRTADVPAMFHAYEAFLASQSPPPRQWYRYIDYSGLVGWDSLALLKVLRELARIDKLFPPRIRFVAGVPRDLRAVAAIGWMSWRGRLESVDGARGLDARVTWYEAQRLLPPAKGGMVSRLRDRLFRRESLAARELMEFIGELQWDVAGTGRNPYPDDHPLHQIAASLLVVKSDFDALLLERDRRERELEAARERAEEVNRLQARFLANVSHEIRTPLNAVLGMGELLGDTPLEPRQQDLLRTLRQSAQGLLGVINDILDLSRMEAGEFRLSQEPFDLASVLGEVGSMIGYLASTRGLDFAVSRSPSLPRGILGDPVRLRQILINLAGNAVKFTEEGCVTVRATIDPDLSSHDRSCLVLEVEDSGPGIPPDKIDELFRPFKQLDGSFTRRHGGTGLGLAIARNLAERMGGSITVHPAPVRGTIFRFQAMFAHAAVVAPSEGGGDAHARLEGRILLAEDNRVNQKVALGLLSKLGVDAVAVDNGQRALDLLASGGSEFRCVLMDIQMPVMDGLEAVRRIRAGEAGEAARKLPIFALTAHAMDGDREAFLNAGMDGYLSKPIRLADLRAALESVLLESG